MTREEAIEELKIIKEYFEEESDATPICLEYAIEALKADVARWSSWSKTFEQSGISDLIRRSDAVEAINKRLQDWASYGNEEYRRGLYVSEDIINALLTADKPRAHILNDGSEIELDEESYEIGYTHGQMADRPHGEWIRKGNTLKCPFCGAIGEEIQDDYCFNFCPNCGCAMDKGEE